jgi:hypothetical protein
VLHLLQLTGYVTVTDQRCVHAAHGVASKDILNALLRQA